MTMDSEQVPFNKILRQATRDIHSISDALVKTKFVFALSDKNVWAEGLLVFYEIFRFLENSMIIHKDTNLGKMFIDGMERTTAFEKDLQFYLGEDWKKTYAIRESVGKYLAHLKELEKTNPDLLIAYVYHLYMGLLSGGQILRSKLKLAKLVHVSKNEPLGNAVTDFGEFNIRDLKQNIVNNLNSISNSLDDDTKSKIISESRTVFELNNEIINSIQEANFVFFKQVLFCLILVLIITVVWKHI